MVWTRMIFKPLVGMAAMIGVSSLGLGQFEPTSEVYRTRRERLIESVLKPGGIKSQAVLDAIGKTPREEFVPAELRDQAYLDRALPIGESQTISSPFIVALMTEVLSPQPTDKVLEIGTGSGYQAAVLSPLVRDVYTIEIVPSLAAATERLLRRLGYENIHQRTGDGFAGWPEHAPFDKIIVTCSPEKPPQPLIDQLREDGLMIIPVGSRYQQLLHVFQKKEGRLISQFARPTLFVPMTGEAEAERRLGDEASDPQILNGDFETTTDASYIPNWYYEFGATLVTDAKAPSGSHYVRFSNEKRGNPAGLLQGLPLDGRRIKRLRLSGYAACENVKISQDWNEQPFLVIQFLDGDRNRISYNWLGPFVGDQDWKKVEGEFDVPSTSRDALIMIGLFGAVGSASFDKITLEVVERKAPDTAETEERRTKNNDSK